MSIWCFNIYNVIWCRHNVLYDYYFYCNIIIILYFASSVVDEAGNSQIVSLLTNNAYNITQVVVKILSTPYLNRRENGTCKKCSDESVSRSLGGKDSVWRHLWRKVQVAWQEGGVSAKCLQSKVLLGRRSAIKMARLCRPSRRPASICRPCGRERFRRPPSGLTR